MASNVVGKLTNSIPLLYVPAINPAKLLTEPPPTDTTTVCVSILFFPISSINFE